MLRHHSTPASSQSIHLLQRLLSNHLIASFTSLTNLTTLLQSKEIKNCSFRSTTEAFEAAHPNDILARLILQAWCIEVAAAQRTERYDLEKMLKLLNALYCIGDCAPFRKLDLETTSLTEIERLFILMRAKLLNLDSDNSVVGLENQTTMLNQLVNSALRTDVGLDSVLLSFFAILKLDNHTKEDSLKTISDADKEALLFNVLLYALTQLFAMEPRIEAAKLIEQQACYKKQEAERQRWGRENRLPQLMKKMDMEVIDISPELKNALTRHAEAFDFLEEYTNEAFFRHCSTEDKINLLKKLVSAPGPYHFSHALAFCPNQAKSNYYYGISGDRIRKQDLMQLLELFDTVEGKLIFLKHFHFLLDSPDRILRILNYCEPRIRFGVLSKCASALREFPDILAVLKTLPTGDLPAGVELFVHNRIPAAEITTILAFVSTPEEKKLIIEKFKIIDCPTALAAVAAQLPPEDRLDCCVNHASSQWKLKQLAPICAVLSDDDKTKFVLYFKADIYYHEDVCTAVELAGPRGRLEIIDKYLLQKFTFPPEQIYPFTLICLVRLLEEGDQLRFILPELTRITDLATYRGIMQVLHPNNRLTFAKEARPVAVKFTQSHKQHFLHEDLSAEERKQYLETFGSVSTLGHFAGSKRQSLSESMSELKLARMG